MSYIHRFVTTDPGEFTFGKRDEESESELLTESEEIICLRETIRLLEAGQKRQEGEVWQGAGNRWFTIRNGRAVPTKRPADGGEQAKQPGKQDDAAPTARQPKAKPTEKPARVQKAKAPTVDELHDAIKQAAASGKPVSADDVRALAERVKAMKVDDIKALRVKSGLTKTTGKGTKDALADDLARKMLGGETAKKKSVVPSVDELIGKLKQLDADSYEVPFGEIDQMPGYTLDLEKDELNKRFASAPEVEVSLDDLVATQDMVYDTNLRYAMSGGAAEEPPRVVKQGGKYYLDDGTHRAAVAKLQGVKKLKVKLLDLDAPKSAKASKKPAPKKASARPTPEAPKPQPVPKATPQPAAKIANVQQGREHVMSIMDKVEPMTPYEMEDLLATVTPESRESLDRAIWQLVRERKVFVQRENNPGLLSDKRKAQLLSDGEGGYYQTIVRYGEGM